MKALAWYTIIFEGMVLIGFILNAAGIVGMPPFTRFEVTAWAVFTVPVFILGILAARRRG